VPRRPTPPAAAERPWDDGWLRERFYTHYPRRRSRLALPRPSAAPSTRRLSADQLRALRARWLGLSVTLHDFTGRPRCSRRLAVHRACTLHELVTVLCAAVAFTDDEHLYRFETTRGNFSPWELSVYSSDGPVTKSLEEIGFGSRARLHLHYDMGDSWHFVARAETLPLALTPALRGHERASDIPALQYGQAGRAPQQYPKCLDDDW
jgi:hypothetical protein